MNQVFEGDDQTMAKIREKFKCKKALHWFMVNKAVSIHSLFPFNQYIITDLIYRMSSCPKRRIVHWDLSTRSWQARSMSFGHTRWPRWRSRSGLSSPLLTCGNKSRTLKSSSGTAQIPGVSRVTESQRRNISWPWSLPCIQNGSERLSWTDPSSAMRTRKLCYTSRRRLSWLSSGLKSCLISPMFRVSYRLYQNPINPWIKES